MAPSVHAPAHPFSTIRLQPHFLTYGPQGERLSETNVLRGIVSRTFTYDDEDRLLTAGGAEYEFDADGSATTTYDYSSRGELKQVELPDGTVVEYRHDPLGRRVAKLLDGEVTEKYLWMGRTTLLGVYNGDGSLLWRFLYADGRMPMGIPQACIGCREIGSGVDHDAPPATHAD
eukprot:TRINITY_DN1620_c0_g2_i6.p5 TRINITY_DN1620_c0_g2~~TRINITY_DN1620_c0_g2_i6.p5  ORF type:complete len:174 (+),score=49.47 TRINITY_DN1620_c0_g2_i6:1548-2069(+)